MRERGTAKELEYQFRYRAKTATDLPKSQHMQMLPWQMYALHVLAEGQCAKGGAILEIGTGFGTSAYMMARAAPFVLITSITNNVKEAAMARRFLAGKRATVLTVDSAAYFAQSADTRWDMIYLDADHKRCADDLPWFNRLRAGGLMLFHDYSPVACPPVFAAVGALGKALGREPDIDLIDSDGIGMAGFIRQDDDAWPE